MIGSRLEPEWDEEQRDLIVAESIVRANTGRFGEWLPEATSDDADPNSYKIRYKTHERINWAEKEWADADEAARKAAAKEDGNTHGVFFELERFEYPAEQSRT